MSRQEIAELLPHVENCPDCRVELALANETLLEEGPRSTTSRPRPWWIGLGIAAALAIAFFLVRPRSSLDELARLAPRSARIVEARLSGNFAYAPYRGPVRAADPAVEAQQLKLGGAAGEVIERAASDTSADGQRAAGVAYVLIDKPVDAIERLRKATAANPNDAATWSDLAAAQYAAAVHGPAPSLLPDALSSADRALRIDAAHAPALFNRALILERLGLARQARDAWARYLAVDTTTEWAAEARAHLANLPRASSDAQFRRELPRLEQAATANDTAALEPIVRRWREQSRAWGEAQYLGLWGEAQRSGNAPEAARLLSIARSLGREVQRQSGESLLADAVTAIDSGDVATLAEAHAIYRSARIAYSQRQPSAAEPELRRAAVLFTRAKSPMARMARYYAANTRYDQNDVAGARVQLEALLAEESAHSTRFVSSTLIRWELALCHAADGDVEGALALLNDAAGALRRADERSNLGVVEAMTADMLAAAGRPDDAWSARIRSFDVLSRDGRDERLLVNLGSTALAEQRAGDDDAALALLAIEREVGRDIPDHLLRSSTLTRNAVLSAELGDVAGAKQAIAEVLAVAAQIRDPALRGLVDANVQLARGAATLHDDPRGAAAALDAAVGAYAAMGQRAFAIDGRLLRARAAIALGDQDGAARQLDAGLALLAPEVFESGRQLFAEAIRLSLDRGENARAFAYAERSRLRFIEASPQDSLALRLGADAVLLEIVVLPEETVVFTVDNRGLAVTRQRVRREQLIELAARVSAGDRRAATRAFDLLIRPLRRARTLIVVADPILDALPFAALYDSRAGQYLVEQTGIVMAESAAALRTTSRTSRPTRVVAAALPSGANTSFAALPDAIAEIDGVGATYAQHSLLAESTFAAFAAAARDADVVHVSGHTADDGNGGTSALVFSGPERVTWRSITKVAFSRMPVVVLAACDTLRLPQSSAVRAPSLGGAFLAAGAGSVVGTLRPIADRDAYELFRDIHRRLAAGLDVVEAVRETQLAAIAADPRASAWSAIALITREIPNRREREKQS
ncbi:MAG: CHAT domain-containing protein [Acidobacteriota bacterium]|nr:CHAT domain-containing protein [Acidobacteriota bacterium]